MNSGKGIPIEIHEEHNIYIPEMIFGELLTSSNYDDSKERTTGGRNGYGAKLTNIFSKKFMVDIVNPDQKLQYTQVWENNMTMKSKSTIKKNNKTKGYVEITFWPDLKRFGMNSLKEDDILQLFEKRVYDCCACTSEKIKIYLNNNQINIKSFEKYIDMYIGDKKEKPRVYDNVNPRWKIGVAESSVGFNQVSFVNGINTYQGGSHVESVSGQLIKQLTEYIESKHKNLKIKTQYIKEHLFLFVNATIVNPSFSSQTKGECTTKYRDFGSRYVISEDFIKKVAKLGIVDEIVALAKHKENREMNKSDGKKSSKIKIPKLDDAIKAGTKESDKCTLILTEGDSAKTFAISGLSVIGRNYYGVFPLRGKLLNVRDASTKQMLGNEEINNLKQIIGLQQDKKYKDTSELRYGKIMILTDSDVDGSHIKGLLMNFIHTFWPGLMNANFICSMKTPILKATHKIKKQVISFYTKKQYDKCRESKTITNWTIKYYKGLGTSTAKEAKEYFKELKNNMIDYNNTTRTDYVMNLAFNKKHSDDRKTWIKNYQDYSDGEVSNVQTYEDFVNTELINFSVADVMRSIPNVMDGLKPSQRKVLYVCRKKNVTSEFKVSQLSGIVSSQSMYHNGEQSLMGCIIGMAQDYIGSNNINVLEPIGQFGTRLMGGHDSASPRYIFTKLNPITNVLYSQLDDQILNYLEDDGQKIEPDYFLPVIPMVLVNGVDGIGTGYSSKIPCYNPKDVIDNVLKILRNEEPMEMKPWYKGFKGKIDKLSNDKYVSTGNYELSKNVLTITELPVGKWTNDYKEYLDSILDTTVKSYENHSTETAVMFKITLKNEKMDNEELKKEFKLSSLISTTNMHLFDYNQNIIKYTSPIHIIQDFCWQRIIKYEERRLYIIKDLTEKITELKVKISFIELVINDKIVVFRRKLMDIYEDLKKYKIEEKYYSELLTIPLQNFTDEKHKELCRKFENTEEELLKINKQTAKDLWICDINMLKRTLKDSQYIK
jgi:DNA topoisomerase-2